MGTVQNFYPESNLQPFELMRSVVSEVVSIFCCFRSCFNLLLFQKLSQFSVVSGVVSIFCCFRSCFNLLLFQKLSQFSVVSGVVSIFCCFRSCFNLLLVQKLFQSSVGPDSKDCSRNFLSLQKRLSRKPKFLTRNCNKLFSISLFVIC